MHQSDPNLSYSQIAESLNTNKARVCRVLKRSNLDSSSSFEPFHRFTPETLETLETPETPETMKRPEPPVPETSFHRFTRETIETLETLETRETIETTNPETTVTVVAESQSLPPVPEPVPAVVPEPESQRIEDALLNAILSELPANQICGEPQGANRRARSKRAKNSFRNSHG